MMPMDPSDIVTKLRRISESQASLPLGNQGKFMRTLLCQTVNYLDPETLQRCIHLALATFSKMCECGAEEGKHAAHGDWCPLPIENGQIYSSTQRFRPAQKVEVSA